MKKEIIAVTKENDDAYYEYPDTTTIRPLMCHKFVVEFLKVSAPPDKIKIILSSDKEDGFMMVELLKLNTIWYRCGAMGAFDYVFLDLSRKLEGFCDKQTNSGVVYVKIEQIK